jgi:hypothetical protein
MSAIINTKLLNKSANRDVTLYNGPEETILLTKDESKNLGETTYKLMIENETTISVIINDMMKHQFSCENKDDWYTPGKTITYTIILIENNSVLIPPQDLETKEKGTGEYGGYDSTNNDSFMISYKEDELKKYTHSEENDSEENDSEENHTKNKKSSMKKKVVMIAGAIGMFGLGFGFSTLLNKYNLGIKL